MYQYDSKNRAQSEKSKENSPATNKDHEQIKLKMPVQTKSLFSFSANFKDDGNMPSSNYTSRPAQLMPVIPNFSIQMQSAPVQERKGIQPFPIKHSKEQKQFEPASIKPNNTGIPLQMREIFENPSDFSFDDVKVHYNSSKPTQLQALAYTQGNQVYVASGQEKHLGHELGHVVQQKQGRVSPTMHLNRISVNDDRRLEAEADFMSASAAQFRTSQSTTYQAEQTVVQRKAWKCTRPLSVPVVGRLLTGASTIISPFSDAVVEGIEGWKSGNMFTAIPKGIAEGTFGGLKGVGRAAKSLYSLASSYFKKGAENVDDLPKDEHPIRHNLQTEHSHIIFSGNHMLPIRGGNQQASNIGFHTPAGMISGPGELFTENDISSYTKRQQISDADYKDGDLVTAINEVEIKDKFTNYHLFKNNCQDWVDTVVERYEHERAMHEA